MMMLRDAVCGTGPGCADAQGFYKGSTERLPQQRGFVVWMLFRSRRCLMTIMTSAGNIPWQRASPVYLTLVLLPLLACILMKASGRGLRMRTLAR